MEFNEIEDPYAIVKQESEIEKHLLCESHMSPLKYICLQVDWNRPSRLLCDVCLH